MMKLTNAQRVTVNQIKKSGRVWINPAISRVLYNQHMALVKKGALTWEIDGNGVWFDVK